MVITGGEGYDSWRCLYRGMCGEAREAHQSTRRITTVIDIDQQIVVTVDWEDEMSGILRRRQARVDNPGRRRGASFATKQRFKHKIVRAGKCVWVSTAYYIEPFSHSSLFHVTSLASVHTGS